MSARFSLFLEPKISLVSPTGGSIQGGTLVRVVGKDIVDTGMLRCRFGTTVVLATYLSSSLVHCVSPRAEREGPVQFSFSQNLVDWTDESGVTFNFGVRAILQEFGPISGPVSGGTVVTFRGVGFERDSSLFCAFNVSSLRPAQEFISDIQFVSESELRCVSPRVDAPGTVLIDITSRSEPGRLPNRSPSDSALRIHSLAQASFTFLPFIEVLSADPPAASRSGGTKISVHGKNFGSTFNVKAKSFCRFSYENVSHIVDALVIDVDKVECVTPSFELSPSFSFVTVSLTVSYALFESPLLYTRQTFPVFSSSACQFSVYEVLNVSTIFPLRGTSAGGTILQIRGSGLSSDSWATVAGFGQPSLRSSSVPSGNNLVAQSRDDAGAVIPTTLKALCRFAPASSSERDLVFGTKAIDPESTFSPALFSYTNGGSLTCTSPPSQSKETPRLEVQQVLISAPPMTPQVQRVRVATADTPAGEEVQRIKLSAAAETPRVLRVTLGTNESRTSRASQTLRFSASRRTEIQRVSMSVAGFVPNVQAVSVILPSATALPARGLFSLSVFAGGLYSSNDTVATTSFLFANSSSLDLQTALRSLDSLLPGLGSTTVSDAFRGERVGSTFRTWLVTFSGLHERVLPLEPNIKTQEIARELFTIIVSEVQAAVPCDVQRVRVVSGSAANLFTILVLHLCFRALIEAFRF